jgi:hypothetical protein
VREGARALTHPGRHRVGALGLVQKQPGTPAAVAGHAIARDGSCARVPASLRGGGGTQAAPGQHSACGRLGTRRSRRPPLSGPQSLWPGPADVTLDARCGASAGLSRCRRLHKGFELVCGTAPSWCAPRAAGKAAVCCCSLAVCPDQRLVGES